MTDTIIKLEPEAKVHSLFALRRWMEKFYQEHGMPSRASQLLAKLEMTEEQYNEYKRLVFEADFIRYFDGIEIVITPKEQ